MKRLPRPSIRWNIRVRKCAAFVEFLLTYTVYTFFAMSVSPQYAILYAIMTSPILFGVQLHIFNSWGRLTRLENKLDEMERKVTSR